MSAIKQKSIVLTAVNYTSYGPEDFYPTGSGQLATAVSYSPETWRPPAAWYVSMGMSEPKARVLSGGTWHPTKKPGRKLGSAERTARLEIRCQPELLDLLDELTKSSWYFTGYTRADILHELVRKAAMSAFPDVGPELYQLIEKVKGISKPKD